MMTIRILLLGHFWFSMPLDTNLGHERISKLEAAKNAEVKKEVAHVAMGDDKANDHDIDQSRKGPVEPLEAAAVCLLMRSGQPFVMVVQICWRIFLQCCSLMVLQRSI